MTWLSSVSRSGQRPLAVEMKSRWLMNSPGYKGMVTRFGKRAAQRFERARQARSYEDFRREKTQVRQVQGVGQTRAPKQSQGIGM